MLAISNACDTGQNLASGAIYHCSGGRRHWHGMVRTAIEFCRRGVLGDPAAVQGWDFVTAAGVTGTVEEIGLFATTLGTPDNVKTIIGNGKIFADTIQFFGQPLPTCRTDGTIGARVWTRKRRLRC